MVSSAARVGSINVLLSTQLGPGVAGLNAFAGAVDRTGTTVSRRVGGMDKSIAGLNTTLGRINTRGMTGITVGALRASTALDQLRGLALAAGVAVGGLVPAAIASGMIRTVDAAHRLSNQLRTVTNDSNDLKNTQDALFQVAQRTRSAFDSTVTIYARTARATETLGLSQQKLLRLTETVQKSFAIGGATTAEAQGAAIQLSQGIASNRFSGDEFRSVAENAPVLLRGMAESMGVNIGKLREMAHAGELTADVVTKAILEASRRIDEEFAKTTSTIEQAWVKVGNAVTKYAMDSEGASVSSNALVTVLNALSSNIDTVADSLLLLGVGFASILGGRAGSAAAAGITGYISNLKAVRAETLANAEAMKKAATAEALAASTRARQLRQGVITTSRGRKDELGEMRAAMLKANADKAIAAEQQVAAAAQKAGEVRAAADAKAAAAKADATQKWSHFMAVARQEKKEAVDSARAALATAEAQKATTQTRLTGARSYYEMAKASTVSQKTQEKAGKQLQAALQADLRATQGVAAAQTNLQAALDGTAQKSRTYLAAQKALDAAKKQVVLTTAAAAAAELKHTEAVAAHVAAQRTAQAAIASGNLTKEQEAALNKRAEVLERKVAAAKAQSTAATLAARDAARAATAATAQLAAAQQVASLRAIAFAAAGRAASAAWAFIGGPLGASLLAIGAAMYVVSARAAEAEARANRYADAIERAGDKSDEAATSVRNAATEFFKLAASGIGSAERIVQMSQASIDLTRTMSELIETWASAGRGLVNLSTAMSNGYKEAGSLVSQFAEGKISSEEFRAALDRIASLNPDFAPWITGLQKLGDQADAERGRIDALTGSLQALFLSASRAMEAAAGFGDGGVATKGKRVTPTISRNEFLARFGWEDTFPDLFKKPPKTPKGRAPAKTADDRFDNSVQQIYDRIEALRLEREMLGATYYEQVKREEALKLEQEALKQAREEARKKGNADWQNAQISAEKRAEIEAVTSALAEETIATKYAKESVDAYNQAAGDFGGVMRGIIDGTSDWKDALLDLIPVVLKLMNSLNVAQGGRGLLGGGAFQSLIGGLLGFSFHGGGTVGLGGNVVAFPAGAPFVGAAHTGRTIGSGRNNHKEVMALLEKEETVFTKNQTGAIIDRLSASVGGLKEGRTTYAPVYHIDARGTDQAAIARLERGLKERDRTESKRVAGYIQRSQVRGVRP